MRIATTSRKRLALMIGIGTMLACMPTLAAAANVLPGDTFEGDDGDLVVTDPGHIDWGSISPQVVNDLPQANDDNFTIGSQEDKNTALWGVTTGPVSNKTDIDHVYIRSGYPFFGLGIVRNQAAQGTVAYHVEFNQSSAKLASGLPVRTPGDPLFVYDFQGNNLTATLTLYRWVANGTCATNTAAPCWAPGTVLDATQAIGGNNTGVVSDPIGAVTLQPKTFDEMALNLRAALGVPDNQCIDFGQMWLKTRDGGAFGSALSDLLGPIPISVGNCDVKINKDVTSPSLNPASVPYNTPLTYAVAVSLGPNSSPVPLALLNVTDSSTTDPTLTNVALSPVLLVGGVIQGDDGDNVLEQGESWIYARDAAGTPITQTAGNCVKVDNTATVAVTGGDADPTNNTDTVVTNIVCTPDLQVVKSGPKAINYGETITYTIAVSHAPGSDPLPIPAPTVNDQVNSGAVTSLVLMSGDSDGDGALDPGETWIYGAAAGQPFTVVPTSCGPITNVASLTLTDANPANNTSSVTTNVLCPDIQVVKTAQGNGQFTFGDTVTYTVDVSLTAASDAMAIPRSSIVVTDPKISAAPLTFLGAAAGDDGDALLEPGEVWHYGLTAAPLSLPANVCGDLANTANVAPLPGESILSNNTSTATVSVFCALDISLAKTSDKATYVPGETIIYTLTVTNTGHTAIPTAQIQVNDPALTGLAVVGTPPALLQPGANLSFTGTRAATTADCGVVPNTATASLIALDIANGVDPATEATTANNTATHNVTVNCTTDLAIAKTADHATYAPGQTITYAVTVTNTGERAVPFSEIAVSDPTLPTLTLQGVAPQSLAPGGFLTYTGQRTVTAANCGQVTNTAGVRLTGDAVEVTNANNSASVTVTVTGGACNPVIVGAENTTIAITKVGPKTAQARRAITYTIKITNTGASTARNVIVSDPIPAGMSVAKIPTNATVSKRVIRWSIGDLNPGRSVTVTVLLRSDANRAVTRCNIASASAGNAPTVRARACTRFTRIAGAVALPRVTG